MEILNSCPKVKRLFNSLALKEELMNALSHLYIKPDSGRCEIDCYMQHKQYLVFYPGSREHTSLYLNRRSFLAQLEMDVNNSSHQPHSRSSQEYLGNISTKPWNPSWRAGWRRGGHGSKPGAGFGLNTRIHQQCLLLCRLRTASACPAKLFTLYLGDCLQHAKNTSPALVGDSLFASEVGAPGCCLSLPSAVGWGGCQQSPSAQHGCSILLSPGMPSQSHSCFMHHCPHTGAADPYYHQIGGSLPRGYVSCWPLAKQGGGHHAELDPHTYPFWEVTGGRTQGSSSWAKITWGQPVVP